MNAFRLGICVPVATILVVACTISPRQTAVRASTTAPATASTSAAAPARNAATPARPAAAPRPPNYVDAADFDYITLLPPAPQKGSARYQADRQMFLKTRRFKDTPRWVMATHDADAKTADFLHHFSCSLDMELTPEIAPQITKLAQNMSSDSGRLTGNSKNHYKRDRPYLIDKGPICRPESETGKSFDYPSGHTIAGWAWANALAQIAPERASIILARGRAYGESRIVCGVHNVTAVEAGRLAASAVALLAQPSPKFQDDLAAARAEYAELKKSAPKPAPARCAEEKALVAMPLD
jgi:acid phosphatase (class A)